MATEKFTNSAFTTLDGDINDSTTSITVAASTGFPSAVQYRIAIDSEIMIVTAGAGTTGWTVTRGAESTSAVAHLDGATVSHVLTAGSLDQRLADDNQYGACASRPAASKDGRWYYGSDYPMSYRDNGSSWQAFYNNKKATPPTTSNYTWTHAGPTATNTDITNGPSMLDVTSTGAGDRLSKFERNSSLAATPVSYTARVSCYLYGSISFCGIYMGDGTKMASMGFIHESGGTRMNVINWNSITSFSSHVYYEISSPHYGDIWLKITDDGSNRFYSFSYDGYNYQIVALVGRTSFLTATKCGLIIGTNQFAGLKSSMLWISEE